MTEYNSMYGTSLVSRAWHTCQICGISILCDYFSIYQHLTKAHRVSLMDYHNQLMVNYDADRIEWLNMCIFACKICKEEFKFRWVDNQASALKDCLHSTNFQFSSETKFQYMYSRA